MIKDAVILFALIQNANQSQIQEIRSSYIEYLLSFYLCLKDAFNDALENAFHAVQLHLCPY